MYRIVRRKSLNPTVVLMDIEAPRVAKKAEPGQFIILRTDEDGERIPLTIADFDRWLAERNARVSAEEQTKREEKKNTH